LALWSKFNQHFTTSAFPHECSIEPHLRQLPVVVDDQELIYVRHQEGQQHHRRRFADCHHCGHRWTNKELVESYLIFGSKIEGVKKYPDDCNRLKAMAVEYQKSKAGSPPLAREIIEAGYNHHVHAGKSQAAKKKSGQKRKALSKCTSYECRYHYPQSKCQKTCIINTTETSMNLYTWEGTFSNIHVKEVVIYKKTSLWCIPKCFMWSSKSI